jgi:D-arabinonate dehydratase
MKIRSISTMKFRVPLDEPLWFSTREVAVREFTTCQITAEGGITGLGVATISDPHSVAAIIENKLKPYLIGEDLFAYERAWDRMYKEVYRDRMGAAIRAISAVDIAIWDAMGKALGLPVYKLLGGHKDEVVVYASGGYYREGKGTEGLAEEVNEYVQKGYKHVKIRVGALSVREDVERVRAAREAAGPDIKIMLDANNAYAPYEAIRAGREFEKYDVFWFEDPVWPDNVTGSRIVAHALDVPIASGEHAFTRYDFQNLFSSEAIDIAMPDPTVVGGVTEFVKVIGMAAGQSIPVAPHSKQEVNIHMVAAFANAFIVEFYERESDIRKEELLYDSYLQPENGVIKLPSTPGFGRGLSEEAVEKYRID